jgi:hypothetical protein
MEIREVSEVYKAGSGIEIGTDYDAEVRNEI